MPSTSLSNITLIKSGLLSWKAVCMVAETPVLIAVNTLSKAAVTLSITISGISGQSQAAPLHWPLLYVSTLYLGPPNPGLPGEYDGVVEASSFWQPASNSAAQANTMNSFMM